MQDQTPNFLLKPQILLDILFKRRWYLIVPVLVSLTAGLVLSIYLPKSYTAETTILVEPQKVPENYVKSIVSDEFEGRLNTISQQILSRTNLERIIHQFNLAGKKDESAPNLEGAVAGLRGQIKVDLSKDRRRANSFSVSYTGRNPETVRDITNALASSFIDENLKIRETQALGTSDFLESELLSMKRRLEEKEQALRNFRFRYMGELPNQLETNLRLLERLQAQLSEREVSLRDAKSRLAFAQKQLTAIGYVATPDGTGPAGPLTINDLRKELVNLQAKYTDKHPDIIRLKSRIEELEKQGASTTSASPSPKKVTENFEIVGLRQEIRNIEADIAQIKRQIGGYEKRVESTPKREQEFLAIQRDYDLIQGSYNSLLNRKLEAEIAVNMERKQKGEQFQILDPARLPGTPSSPDLRKVFLLILASGFGVGGGLIFLLEFIGPSFRSPDDIEFSTALPVLAIIPTVNDKKAIIAQRINAVLSGSALLLISFMTITMAAFTFLGVEPTLTIFRKIL